MAWLTLKETVAVVATMIKNGVDRGLVAAFIDLKPEVWQMIDESLSEGAQHQQEGGTPMSDKDIWQNYDTVFKDALTLYKNKTLDFLGLDLAMIEEPLNTEMTEVTVNKQHADMCFLLKDRTGLHIEWEADISTADMLRFCAYNLYYLRTYKTSFTTVVVTNRRQTITRFENDMLRFTPIVINLNERDGDALLKKLKAQVDNGEPVNELELIYFPLYYSKHRNVAERWEQIATLVPRVYESKVEKEKILLLSLLLINKLVREEEFKKIWEVAKMYLDDLFIIKFAKEEGMEEGMEKGKLNGKVEVILDLIQSGMDKESIAKRTHLTPEEWQRIEESLNRTANAAKVANAPNTSETPEA